jgi:hypothetical protein
MSVKRLNWATNILLSVALLVCAVFLVRAYWQIYGFEGWKEQVNILSCYRGTVVALDDFHCGNLRVFELDGPHDMPQFSGRWDGDFEVWYAQYFPIGDVDRYATEQFVEAYNRKMRYMHKHPELFQKKAEGQPDQREASK